MASGFSWISYFPLKKFHDRVLYFGNRDQSVGNSCSTNFCSLRSVIALVWSGSLIAFLLAFAYASLYWVPSRKSTSRLFTVTDSTEIISISKCNLFDGKWVVDDESYLLYNASQCLFAERSFYCLANGRNDKGYLNWRWKPKDCDIPRFDLSAVLGHLRGKRVVFVGDSLSRTQWESFICMLVSGIKDHNKDTVYEVNGNEITKEIRFLGVVFSSHNLTVEFYRSVFLVRTGSVPRRAPKRVRSTIKLDKLDEISKEWVDSDILVFNSGHWWTRTKLFKLGVYFEMNGSLKLGMSVPNAFKQALTTWANWVESRVDTNRTLVFFRTFEASHWRKNHHTHKMSCNVTREPMSRIKAEKECQCQRGSGCYFYGSIQK